MSLPRTLLRAPLIGLALVLLAAGCARPGTGQQNNPGSGTGQLGEAPAGGLDAGSAPQPAPTTAPTTAPPTTAPPSNTLKLTVVPGSQTLAWPSPADCISHNPATVAIQASPGLWQIVDGGHALLAYKREVDAQAGLALAKSYKQHCFIGRSNTRTDRASYILDYWLDPVVTNATIPSPDCLTHVPSELKAVDRGTLGWRIETTNEAIALFDTKADADQALLVMKHFNRHCYIGRNYSGADRLQYITDWFATV